MQDYYNTIPAFGVGGLIAKIAKAAGRAKIQGHANLLSKEQPELSKLLSKLAKFQKGGPKLSDKEAERLATLAQNYRRSNIHYQNRRNKLNEQMAAKRKPTQQSAQQTTQEGAQQSTSTPVQPETTNPIPGTTLSGRWKQFRNWMNNHPTTTVGVPLLALGTGPGRYVTGNAFKAIQSNPESWFGNSVPGSETSSDFVMMPDGTKIPIKRSAEGYFVPVSQNNNQTSSVEGDNIDQTLAGITNENLESAPQQQPESMPQVDQQAINDLFDDDQWQ